MAKERARGRRLIVLLAVLALIAAACGGGGDEEEGAGGGGSEGGGGGGEVSGSATIMTAFTVDEDIAGMEAVIAAFNEQYPDAEITHEGSPSFEEQALTRVEGGNPPEMMLIPQPGLMKDFYDRDAALPLDFLDRETIESEYVPGLLQSGTVGEDLVGVPIRLSPKSFVWYSKPAFDEAGYEIPETWEDMVALTDQIKGDMGGEAGRAPWCIGIENAQATGWPLTDWVEDVVLRESGVDVYDQWVGHAINFDSPEITSAFERVADLWFTEGNVLGGRQNIVSTSFDASPAPMFEDPPACLLHRQASFAPQLFGDAEYGTDFDFFYLPPIEEGGTGETPMLTAADLLTVFDDSPVVQAFAEFLITTDAQEAWAAEGSMICANAQCSPDAYPTDLYTRMGETLAEASAARFDASDVMPAQVGTGAFWSEATAWVGGEQELQPTLQAIDAAWPEGACGVGGVGPNCDTTATDTGGDASDATEASSEAGGVATEATSE